MGSLFNKDTGPRGPLPSYSRDRIEPEIAHLRKRGSVRDARQQRRTLGVWVSILIVLALLCLYFMDPVLYAFKRGDALHAYLYLHGFGSEERARALAATGIISANEVDFLNRRIGAFQDYYPTPTAAAQDADAVIRYMRGLNNLHQERYDQLDGLGKIRYQLFVRWGIPLPVHWDFLDPSVTS